MTVIDGATLTTQTVTVGDCPFGVAVNTVTNKVYVATCGSDPSCASNGTVTVIDGSTLSTQDVTMGIATVFVAVNSVTRDRKRGRMLVLSGLEIMADFQSASPTTKASSDVLGSGHSIPEKRELFRHVRAYRPSARSKKYSWVAGFYRRTWPYPCGTHSI